MEGERGWYWGDVHIRRPGWQIIIIITIIINIIIIIVDPTYKYPRTGTVVSATTSSKQWSTLQNLRSPPNPPWLTWLGFDNRDIRWNRDHLSFDDRYLVQQDPPATLSVTTMLTTTPAQFSANNGGNSFANAGHGSSYANGGATNSNQWSTERQVTAT